jgi:hypothetical protein
VLGGGSGETCDQIGQAGARAVGQGEHCDWHFHRVRRDIDNAAESARDHAVQRRLDQRDRRKHVAVERLDPVVALELSEISGRRPTGIVDENVGGGANGNNGIAASFVVTP